MNKAAGAAPIPARAEGETSADFVRRIVAAVEAGSLRREPAVMAVQPSDIEKILHAQFSEAGVAIAVGRGVSPGAAVGRAYFSASAAEDAFDRGEDVILIQTETTPADLAGMEVAEGILTTRGGVTSHAAVVARGLGKPAVCGASALTLADRHFSVADVVVQEGETISIDGASGEVFVGSVEADRADIPDEFDTFLTWADELRAGHIEVRANADTAADAASARAFGAQGIGLCRTEHQFLGERLPLLRRALLATEPADVEAALDAIAAAQRFDFEAILEAMDGLPVTVRLLDPPLHEFLPDLGELELEQALATLTPERADMLAGAREWAEANPMMGTRGVRLGVLKPELYRTQVRALVEAAVARQACGGTPIVEIMVPLVVASAELAVVRGWIDEEIAAGLARADDPQAAAEISIMVGSMIESPRAALCAAAIADQADFFSFGTNDLTQMTFGFSRDDVEARIMGPYLDGGLLPANPFTTLDREGVGQLVLSASAAASAAKPGIKLGVCGEHGGDPSSIDFFFQAGLDYVSCSPFRVPVARLAAAQAVLADIDLGADDLD